MKEREVYTPPRLDNLIKRYAITFWLHTSQHSPSSLIGQGLLPQPVEVLPQMQHVKDLCSIIIKLYLTTHSKDFFTRCM